MTVQTARSRGAAFFEELRTAWGHAADAAGGVERRAYRVGGSALELRLAGAALLGPLTRALAHLDPPTRSDDSLVVYAWESTTTGITPRAPWDATDYLEYGKIRGFFDERLQSVFQWGSHSLVMLDVERNEAIYWVRAAGQIPYFEMAAPLRLVLHGWLGTQGVDLVHAAAVCSGEGCALVVGKAGSGKSWTTLAAVEGGLRILADDYCLAVPGEPPRIASVYNAAKTHADALERLPFLARMVSNPRRPDDDKAVYFLHEQVPDRLLLEADLRAVVIPRRSDGTAAVPSAASRAAALAALAPSTILQFPASDAATLARLTALVRDVPSYFLDVGSDLASIGPAIAGLVDG